MTILATDADDISLSDPDLHQQHYFQVSLSFSQSNNVEKDKVICHTIEIQGKIFRENTCSRVRLRVSLQLGHDPHGPPG